MQFPIGIAITPGDAVFVTDNKNKRVQQFSTEGKFISQFPVPGVRLGGIGLDKQGNLTLPGALFAHEPQARLSKGQGTDPQEGAAGH